MNKKKADKKPKQRILEKGDFVIKSEIIMAGICFFLAASILYGTLNNNDYLSVLPAVILIAFGIIIIKNMQKKKEDVKKYG